MEGYFFEPYSAVALDPHRAGGVVLVGHDLDTLAGTERQVEQHVAGRNGHEEQLFRIVLVLFAAKRWIGCAHQIGLSGDDHSVLSAVASVAAGTSTEISFPDHSGRVLVHCLRHRSLHS